MKRCRHELDDQICVRCMRERIQALEAALRGVMPLLAECDCIYSDRDAPLCPCRAARALLTPSETLCVACSHADRYHFDDGHGNIVCRAIGDCVCVHRTESVTASETAPHYNVPPYHLSKIVPGCRCQGCSALETTSKPEVLTCICPAGVWPRLPHCPVHAEPDQPERDHVDTLFEEANSGFGSGSDEKIEVKS